MKILLTGGTGQLGAALSRALLARGDEVRALVRDPGRATALAELGATLHRGDVTAPDSLADALRGVEAVLHSAGAISYWGRRRAEVMAVNVGGTRNLLEAAARAGARRFLFTSSIASLGSAPEGALGDEDTPWNWDGVDLAYFESKRAAEQLVFGETRLEGLAVNPGIVLGAADVNMNGARLMLQVWRGRMPGLPPGATTTANLDDVVEGHLLALDRGTPGTRAVLGGATPTFAELFSEIGEVVGRPPPARLLSAGQVRALAWAAEAGGWLTGQEPALTRPQAEILIRNRRYRSDRAVETLGYRPGPLRAGLEACWRWCRDAGLAR